MNFAELSLPGAYVIDLEPIGDERGFFARMLCQEEFGKHGLDMKIVQANVSYSAERGTLRGLHYQIPPHGENKLIRCVRGAVFDVMVDLRPDSPTYLAWEGVELSAQNRRMAYVPEGFAHGFLTLTDDCEVLYPVTAAYAPSAERGLRYDDPSIDIEWPATVRVVSKKDQSWPLLSTTTSSMALIRP
jgi:dTDP-4-dehydrorhamnose 3,5-epimerase